MQDFDSCRQRHGTGWQQQQVGQQPLRQGFVCVARLGERTQYLRDVVGGWVNGDERWRGNKRGDTQRKR